MRRNQARLQILALLLLGAVGLLSLDLGPVRAAVANYLAGMPAAEASAEAPPATAPRAPTAFGGERARPRMAAHATELRPTRHLWVRALHRTGS